MSAAAAATAAAARNTGRVLFSEKRNRAWKNVQFRPIESSDYTKIIDHLTENHLKSILPKVRRIGKLSQSALNNYTGYILDLLRQQQARKRKLSFIAVNSDTNKIAAVQLCRVDSPYTIPEYSQRLQKFKYTGELENFNYLYSQLYVAGNLFKRYPLVECSDNKRDFEVVTIDSSSVSTTTEDGQPDDSSAPGSLSDAMLTNTIEVARDAGYSAVQRIFSYDKYGIAMRFGFIEMATIYHRDCYDQGGKMYFPYLTGITAKEEELAKHSLMVKFL